MRRSIHRLNMRTACIVFTIAVVSTAASGCTGLWDELTKKRSSRDLHGYFFPPDPLVVIRDSSDAGRRAEAFSRLSEPAQNGGGEKEQQYYLSLLQETAEKDPDPLTRLAAVRRLGKTKDPLAVEILKTALFQKLPFTSEMNSRVRQEAMRSLATTGRPEAAEWLIRIAKQPGASDEDSLRDKQLALDERLVALRGLSKFSQPRVHEVLIEFVENEKEIALRDRALTSLREATGRNLPADGAAWRKSLQENPEITRPSGIERVMWWKN